MLLSILSNNNLDLLILSFIPAVFYSILFFTSSPKGSIHLGKGLLFFLLGTVSIFFVTTVHQIFPNWRAGVSSSTDLSLFVFAFVQVALLEEVAKLSAFLLTDKIRKRSKEHPLALMFYSMATALGFAVFETFRYGIMTDSGEVVLARSITAILCHMIASMGIGYFIALGRSNYQLGTRSVLDLDLKKNPRSKRFMFGTIGLMFATFYHGIYDHNLMSYTDSSISIMIITLSFGLWICYRMFKHLTKLD